MSASSETFHFHFGAQAALFRRNPASHEALSSHELSLSLRPPAASCSDFTSVALEVAQCGLTSNGGLPNGGETAPSRPEVTVMEQVMEKWG